MHAYVFFLSSYPGFYLSLHERRREPGIFESHAGHGWTWLLFSGRFYPHMCPACVKRTNVQCAIA